MSDDVRPPGPPSPPAPPGHAYSSYELRRLGEDYLRRANDQMANARHGGAGDVYVPLPESAAEHAGHYIVQNGTARAALESLDYQLRHVDPGENEALWREARAILAAVVARERH